MNTRTLTRVYARTVTHRGTRTRGRYWADKATGFVRSQVNLPLPLANPRLHNWTWAPFRP
jgi:hypothetical protein